MIIYLCGNKYKYRYLVRSDVTHLDSGKNEAIENMFVQFLYLKYYFNTTTEIIKFLFKNAS